MSQVYINDFSSFLEKKTALKKIGKEHIKVIADFDRTITKERLPDGSLIGGMMSLLIDSKKTSDEYSEKGKALFEHYFPIEKNLMISPEEKEREMETWWKKCFDLMAEYKIPRSVIQEIVDDTSLMYRTKMKEIFFYLQENHIPLSIYSAGITQMIKMYLKKHSLLLDNINIISNELLFNENDEIMGVSSPIIHICNKKETEKTDAMQGAILMGDSLEDGKMVNPKFYDTVIRIGFFNSGDDYNKKLYKESFDAIITDDGSADFIYDLLINI